MARATVFIGRKIRRCMVTDYASFNDVLSRLGLKRFEECFGAAVCVVESVALDGMAVFMDYQFAQVLADLYWRYNEDA